VRALSEHELERVDRMIRRARRLGEDLAGLSGALRFAIQTERGHGDYADLRHRTLGSLSVDQLLTRMEEREDAATRGSGRP
jgi:hypothetical protein